MPSSLTARPSSAGWAWACSRTRSSPLPSSTRTSSTTRRRSTATRRPSELSTVFRMRVTPRCRSATASAW
eukprot:10800586-Alexandrium_andersonii.AAC.1